jgi:hypothetical protein
MPEAVSVHLPGFLSFFDVPEHQYRYRKRRARLGLRDLAIAEERTIERPFGWVFFLAETPPTAAHGSNTLGHGPIIVRKYVEQVVASSTVYPLDRFIRIYEKLLAESRRTASNWCLTLSLPHSLPLDWDPTHSPPLPPRNGHRERIAKKAKQAGFYEIRQL